MTYCFDLDGTLCSDTYGNYHMALPFFDRIEMVNKLFDNHKIIIDTARGSTTNIDWTELTIKQLEEWGVKYHSLKVGKKIDADLFVDNKAINSNEFFKNESHSGNWWKWIGWSVP